MSDELLQLCGVTNVHHVGSRSFMAEGKDDDYIVLSIDWQGTLFALTNKNFEIGGSVPANEIEREQMSSDFVSLSLGEINIILTSSEDFYRKFVAANDFVSIMHARYGVFTNKQDRIDLFQLALYGNTPTKEKKL